MKKTIFSTVFLFFCTLSMSISGKDFKFVQKFQGIIGYNNSLAPMTVSYDKLPSGTQVTITNFSNGKQVHATVAGNGAVQKGRLLDVSSDVADQLGFTKDGIAYANIVVDKINTFNPMDAVSREAQQDASNEAEDTPPAPPRVVKKQDVETDTRRVNKIVGEPDHIDNKAQDLNVNRIFVIQFGAFSTLDRAQQFQDKLARNGVKTYIAREGANGRDLYKVREASIYRDLQAVFSQVLRYQKQGYPDCFAVGKFFLAKNNQDVRKDSATYVNNTNTGIQTNSGSESIPQTDTDDDDADN